MNIEIYRTLAALKRHKEVPKRPSRQLEEVQKGKEKALKDGGFHIFTTHIPAVMLRLHVAPEEAGAEDVRSAQFHSSFTFVDSYIIMVPVGALHRRYKLFTAALYF